MTRIESSHSNPAISFYNWSGYYAGAASPFNEVQTTFVQPSVTCTVPGAWTVFWVGFDGVGSNTVEQTGTAAQCGVAGNPHPIYYAWWEMWPSNSIQEMPIAIGSGDTIQATVKYTASQAQYAMTVNDLTHKQQSTALASCASNLTCARSSAEWVVERPSYSNGEYAPLADWSAMKLLSNEASDTTKTVTTGDRRHRVTTVTNVLQTISAFNNTPIDMVSDPNFSLTLASVGKLDRTGTAFTDTWQAAQ